MNRCVLAVLLALCMGGSAAAADTRGVLAAARDGATDALRAALRDGGDANAAEADGTRALHHATRRDDIQAVRLLLAAGADAGAATVLDVTALELACLNGNAQIVRELLRAGADAGTRDLAGETMLMAAARADSAEVVQLLLEAGADLAAREPQFGQTALIIAARAGSAHATRALIRAGAELGIQTRTGPEPAFRRIGGTQGKGVEKSPARGARPAIPGGRNALHYAARDGHLEVVRALLDAGAAIEAADPNGITALLFAASNDRPATARLLIDRGADINVTDWYGRTPLWAAIDVRNRDNPEPHRGSGTDLAGNLALIRELLSRGAHPDPRIREMPVTWPHLPLGSLSWVDFTGQTPFIRAALAGDVEVMRLLLQHGADARIATTHGTTALAAAAGVNWTVAQTVDHGPQALLEAVRLCFEQGIDVNAANSKGIRAIHGAANRGSNEIIRFLAAHGADLRARDSEARTPLDWAQGVFLATHPPMPRPETVTLLTQLLEVRAAENGRSAD